MPPMPDACTSQDWVPFKNQVQFELVSFLYQKVQMSTSDIDTLLNLWTASHAECKCPPPFQSHWDMYKTIDAIEAGAMPWDGFVLRVYYHDPHLVVKNMLLNPDFNSEADYAPYLETDAEQNHMYHNFMSGDWVWKKADQLQTNPAMHGAMLVPILLGSDKPTTSVATGDNEYYPLYMSIGNLHNNVQQAHHDALEVIAFLAIAKTVH
ncbi:hypothetical protein APHAL10511_006603 [Amanita phalloides]|nr:hypothetical protein APHAL10511_006603 [Amanita phalloides]